MTSCRMRVGWWAVPVAFGTGIAAGHLLDPDRGKARRARLRDQTTATARRAAEEAGKRVRYETGRMKGLMHEVFGSDEAPGSDEELLQKVRSEALGPSLVPTRQVDLTVSDGEVVITGQVDDTDVIDDLIERINRVAGVSSVRSEVSRTR